MKSGFIHPNREPESPNRMDGEHGNNSVREPLKRRLIANGGLRSSLWARPRPDALPDKQDPHHLRLKTCGLFSSRDCIELRLDEELSDSEVSIHSSALWWGRSEIKDTDHTSRPTSAQRASVFNEMEYRGGRALTERGMPQPLIHISAPRSGRLSSPVVQESPRLQRPPRRGSAPPLQTSQHQ